jgi:hypothetical protein
VAEDTWQRAQRRLADNKRYAARNSKVPSLLQGLAVERGPLTPPQLGGSWSAYWYNGYVYSSDIVKGLDVLRITDTQGIPSANRVKQHYLTSRGSAVRGVCSTTTRSCGAGGWNA